MNPRQEVNGAGSPSFLLFNVHKAYEAVSSICSIDTKAVRHSREAAHVHLKLDVSLSPGLGSRTPGRSERALPAWI